MPSSSVPRNRSRVVTDTRVFQIECSLETAPGGIGDLARLVQAIELSSFNGEKITPKLAVNLGSRRAGGVLQGRLLDPPDACLPALPELRDHELRGRLGYGERRQVVESSPDQAMARGNVLLTDMIRR